MGTAGYSTIGSPGTDAYVLTVGAAKDGKALTRADDVVTKYSSKGPPIRPPAPAGPCRPKSRRTLSPGPSQCPSYVTGTNAVWGTNAPALFDLALSTKGDKPVALREFDRAAVLELPTAIERGIGGGSGCCGETVTTSGALRGRS